MTEQTPAVNVASTEEDYDPFEEFNKAQGMGAVRDPYPELHALRADSPIKKIKVKQPGAPHIEHEVWAITGYEAVTDILRDHGERFSSKIYRFTMGPIMGRTILEMDEPEHTTYRSILRKAFSRKALERWDAELVQPIADRLLAGFKERGRAELVREFTFQLPVEVITGLVGIKPKDRSLFHRAAIDLINFGANRKRAQKAANDLATLIQGYIDERRDNPQDDIISILTHAEVDGTRMTDEEIISFVRLLAPAGAETTYRSSSNLLFGLLTHPDQLQAVVDDRSLLPKAIEEGYRWECPLLNINRMCIQTTEVCGVEIPAGSPLMIDLGAANRDPARFDEPDRFNIFRESKTHVAFAFGVHRCLGIHLATLETTVMLNTLFDNLKNLRLDPAADDPHITGRIFRSPQALPVLFD